MDWTLEMYSIEGSMFSPQKIDKDQCGRPKYGTKSLIQNSSGLLDCAYVLYVPRILNH